MKETSYVYLLNRLGERIAERSRDQYLFTNMPLAWARFAAADIIMPEFAYEMEMCGLDVLEKEDAVEIIERCLEKPWPKCVMAIYGFMVDEELTRHAVIAAESGWVLWDMVNKLDILKKDEYERYSFVDENEKKLFTAMAVCNRIAAAAEGLSYMEGYGHISFSEILEEALGEVIRDAMSEDELPF